MSGYNDDTNPSKLGGGFKGQSAQRFGNALVGGEVAKNRAILRRAFRNNNVKNNNGQVVGKKTCGPYRSAVSLGDGLTRLNKSCGASNQVKSSSRLSGVSLGNGTSNKDCSLSVNVNGTNITPLDLPLESGNSKFVSDSSNYTTFKSLEGVNKTYNDKSFGGDNHRSSYSFLNKLRN
tara:strand:+ start:245 stop:775 length:531 start_codon:yes stop_codon:yes gene_type:complete